MPRIFVGPLHAVAKEARAPLQSTRSAFSSIAAAAVVRGSTIEYENAYDVGSAFDVRRLNASTTGTVLLLVHYSKQAAGLGT
jgi:hypothetical protein